MHFFTLVVGYGNLRHIQIWMTKNVVNVPYMTGRVSCSNSISALAIFKYARVIR